MNNLCFIAAIVMKPIRHESHPIEAEAAINNAINLAERLCARTNVDPVANFTLITTYDKMRKQKHP